LKSAAMLVVFYRRLGIHMTCHTALLCENVTSSTKPEVHNVSQRRHRRTEPEQYATSIKIDQVRPRSLRVMRADRQTSRQTDIGLLITLLSTTCGQTNNSTINAENNVQMPKWPVVKEKHQNRAKNLCTN